MPFCSGIPGQRIGSKLSTPLQRGALTLWVSGGTGRGGTIPPRPHSWSGLATGPRSNTTGCFSAR